MINRAFQDHANATQIGVAVEQAVPVLYFGDRVAYEASPLRIVTVGKNPSWCEFPDENPFFRFPRAANIQLPLNEADRGQYIESLNDYFQVNPYWNWFDSYLPLLWGFNCSYAQGRQNRAIHTDLLTPVATTPTWSGLTQVQRHALAATGVPLWHSLISQLRPHIVLVSFAEHCLEHIEFNVHQEWRDVPQVPRHPPYVIRHSIRDVGEGHLTDFVFGRAGYRPFQALNIVEKEGLAGHLRRCLHN